VLVITRPVLKCANLKCVINFSVEWLVSVPISGDVIIPFLSLEHFKRTLLHTLPQLFYLCYRSNSAHTFGSKQIIREIQLQGHKDLFMRLQATHWRFLISATSTSRFMCL